MTRTSLERVLTIVYIVLSLVLSAAFAAKMAKHVPWLPLPIVDMATSIYEYMKEMAPLLIAVVATALASAFQKRSKFTSGLEAEWRGIVSTKNALYAFCEKTYPTADEYVAAFCRISETLDTMRIVYRNVGETDDLIGLYPYAPLHDMRRALQTLDPRKDKNITPEYRKLVRDAVLQSFYALRENFLEELDLEQPVHPLLISAGRRLKRKGYTSQAKGQLDQQRRRQNDQDKSNVQGRREDIDELLGNLHAREENRV